MSMWYICQVKKFLALFSKKFRLNTQVKTILYWTLLNTTKSRFKCISLIIGNSYNHQVVPWVQGVKMSAQNFQCVFYKKTYLSWKKKHQKFDLLEQKTASEIKSNVQDIFIEPPMPSYIMSLLFDWKTQIFSTGLATVIKQ